MLQVLNVCDLGLDSSPVRKAFGNLFWLYLKRASQSSRDCLLSLSFSISKDFLVACVIARYRPIVISFAVADS